MRRTPTALLIALVLACAWTTDAGALEVTDADREVYDQLYKEKLYLVRRTRSNDDNLTLAQEMMRQAQAIPDSPVIQSLIYTDVIALCAEGGALQVMTAAAEQLDAVWPGHEAARPAALVQLADRAYRESPFDQRGKVAEPYLDLLLLALEKAEQDGALEAALDYGKQAALIARGVGSPKRELIDQVVDRLDQASERANRVRMLSISVRKNPRNKAAARELVQLLFVEQDDAQAAVEFAELVDDIDLTEVIQVAAGGLDQARAPDALRVADWYFGKADELDDELAVSLLNRACRWYGRFMRVYPRDDTLAKRVKLMDAVAKGRLDRVGQPYEPQQAGEWIDLIGSRFDPQRDALGGANARITVQDNALASDRVSFYLPVSPAGGYEMRLRFTVHEPCENKSAFVLYLPVGSTGATARYTHDGQRVCWIDGVPGAIIDEQSVSRVGKEIDLLIEVTVGEEDQAGITLLSGDKPAMRWKGAARELTPSAFHSPGQEKGNIFRFNCPTKITFHEIKLRER